MLHSVRVRAAAALLIVTALAAGVVLFLTGSALVEIFAASLTAGALGVLVITLIFRPLGHMAAVARRIAAGELHARLTPRPPGELGDLADAFNQMAQSIEGLVGAASHERNRLMAALNSSLDAVLAVDVEGRVTFANLAAERLLGRSQTGLLGGPVGWLMPHQEVLDALKMSRDESRSEVRFIERPGRRHFQVTCTPILDGGDWSALVVLHDLTDVKRVEQVRRDFVANVSHELRTPLASIKAVLETLASGALDERDVALEFVNRADNEVERLVQLVAELLELSRIESGDLPLTRAPVEIGKVLQEAVERLWPQAEKLGVNLNLQVVEALPVVEGDAPRLEQAVINLIHNALKFTPQGGSVYVTATVEDGRVSVTVRDTGVGIARSEVPRIFERFYKGDQARRSGGTGLGLAVVKHTVEAHGGSVKVESEQGKGSAFSFSLPAGS
jgi:two-component system, OmpR family, phosphate regulon sensor histidine kinase PhoR